MSDAKDKHEPSMEEILASIRRIISEDGEEEAGEAPAPPRAEDDVLVLTDEVDSEGVPVPRAAGEGVPAEPPSPVEEPVAVPSPKPESEPVSGPEPAPRLPEASHSETEFEQRLISETAAAASLSSLSQLVNHSDRDPNVQNIPLGQTDKTLEDLVRDLLRPMLKNWLDDNLPQLVERIVREEIGRLALDVQRR